MFGYVTVNIDELKIKDHRKYKSYYCGVCHSLKKRYGFFARMTLSYDMTFLAVFLSSLYEEHTEPFMERCIPHPFNKHETIVNEYTDYAAAMNVMLSYYKMKDDWEDERSIKSRILAVLLKKAYKKASSDYPKQAKAVETYIKEQHECEQEKDTSVDAAANPTGRMLGVLFAMRNDEWQQDTERMGFFLGKFIYIMDAFDDVDKDIKKGSFNPLVIFRNDSDFKERCEQMLVMVAAETAKAFERMPILDNADILRNIIYSGMWSRFNEIINTTDKKK